MKLILLVILVMLVSVNLSAQADSTFVHYYYPTSPEWWGFENQILAANVFEAHDGRFVLQSLALFDNPPSASYLSPMILYSRDGIYDSIVFGPYSEGPDVDGSYTRIVKDGLGGYFAVDSLHNRLHRLDANLQYVEVISLFCNNDMIRGIHDVIATENGIVVLGHLDETDDIVVSKFDHSLVSSWHHQTPGSFHPNPSIENTSDGGFLLKWSYSPLKRLMKISAEGDSLWAIGYNTGAYKENIFESDGNYYGLRYYQDTVENGLLKVYDYGAECSNISSDTPILTISTYRLLAEYIVFPAIRTSDNCIVLAVSTPEGEIFKFDSNFNLLWSSNALPSERIGIGKHPLIELDNGDILYCATIRINGYPQHLGLARIDANGNYVGVSDETEQTPPVRCISAYPNPFSTEITLSTKRRILPTSKFIIYNIKGQQIESLDLSDTSVTWTPKDIPSGLYIVKLLEDLKIIESRLFSYIK